MGKIRKYICYCGKDFTTSEGLQKHLKKEGCPIEQVKVVDVKTGEFVPYRQGRVSSSERVVATATGSVPLTKGAQVVRLEGSPVDEIEEMGREGEKKKTQPTVSPLSVSLFQMVPMTAIIYNTPELWTSFAVAKVRGFKGSLDDFLSAAAMDFWLGRGINPFEELTVLFQEVPSSLEEKLSLAMGGGDGPKHPGMGKEPAEEEDAEPE